MFSNHPIIDHNISLRHSLIRTPTNKTINNSASIKPLAVAITAHGFTNPSALTNSPPLALSNLYILIDESIYSLKKILHGKKIELVYIFFNLSNKIPKHLCPWQLYYKINLFDVAPRAKFAMTPLVTNFLPKKRKDLGSLCYFYYW